MRWSLILSGQGASLIIVNFISSYIRVVAPFPRVRFPILVPMIHDQIYEEVEP